jgi:hypothetical protein
LGKLTLKQLTLLKLVVFPVVMRYNSYVRSVLVSFEVIQEDGLMDGMNIFTVREQMFETVV